MDLKTLEAAMHSFVQAKGWYDADSSRPQTSKNLAVSLVLEASEVLEFFQWTENTNAKNELADELADVMLYLLQLASINDVELGQSVLEKLEKIQKRIWK
jgi:NTP pyrophosphatase (non-canonical NTP hydrolase)